MPDRVQLYIYDHVGGWDGATAQSVVDRLAEYGQADGVDVYVNSVGGEVFEGLGIYNALLRHGGDVTVHVDGLAASIASVIAQAGDERRISRAGLMMIHNPMWFAGGDSDDMRKSADVLDQLRDTLATVYASRSGTDPEDWYEAMKAETWYTAEEAVAAGLADVVTEAKTMAADDEAAPENVFRRALLARNAGDRPAAPLAARLVAPERRVLVPVNSLKMPVSAQSGRKALVEVPFNGLPPTADNLPQLVTAMADRNSLVTKIKNALGITSDDDLDILDETRKAATNAARVTELEATNATLTKERDAAREAKSTAEARAEELEKAEDERLLEEAVATFRIKAAERDGYAEKLTNDREGTRALLAALPENGHKPGATAPAPKATSAVEPPDEGRQPNNRKESMADYIRNKRQAAG